MVTFFVKKTLGISPNGASVPEASESSSPDASTFDSNSSKSLSTSEKKITTQYQNKENILKYFLVLATISVEKYFWP